MIHPTMSESFTQGSVFGHAAQPLTFASSAVRAPLPPARPRLVAGWSAVLRTVSENFTWISLDAD